MKKYIFTLLLSFAISSLWAQAVLPSLGESAKNIKTFVPNGWKIVDEAKGDLNKDGLIDVVFVVEDTNPKNFIKNPEGVGVDTLNINPRALLVLFKKSSGLYTLIAKNTGFIPSENSEESPCLLDPFGENGSIEIKRGLLKIHFQNFYSCRAWEIYNFDYTFRYQNAKFELIGYDKSSMHRSSGEETALSMNFSTSKMNYISGTNAFKEGGGPKTVNKVITAKKLIELNTITESAIDTLGY